MAKRKRRPASRGTPISRHNDAIIDACIRAAIAAGWTVEQRHGGHLVFRSPDRRVPLIHGSMTPSDWRGSLNLRALLRRHGLNVQ